MWHIHNGDVAVAAAKRTAIPGEHTPFRECLAVGPVPATDRLEARARFLSEAYGENLLKIRTELLERESALDAASAQSEVILWFEHDLFCFFNFVYLLTRLAKHPRVSAIWSEQSIGLMDPDEMMQRFESRPAVTPSMVKIANGVWRAYTDPDPGSLQSLMRNHSDFPFVREAILLHLSRYPSVHNGLGALENRALSILAAGPLDFGALFNQLNSEVPRFSFGDNEVMRMLWHMANVAVPLVTMTRANGDPPPKTLVTITPAGTNVLEGKVDALSVNPLDTWLGGVHLTGENVWRWDEAEGKLIRSPTAAS